MAKPCGIAATSFPVLNLHRTTCPIYGIRKQLATILFKRVLGLLENLNY